ncbi:MAG TPA: von Willebrand factor type A domain-containing protein, partial [Planctomycetota bacterium]|nr:von Willebrand factor type A domain-containing protein [Planctomycetota bacterium]
GAAGAEGTVSLPRATTATSHGGAYHGPSDTVPPGGGGGTGGGPSTPGPAGLAGPGPNAPGYPTRAGGADLPVLNTPELVSEREAMRQKLGQEPTKAPAESAPVPQTAQRKSGAGKELAKSQDGPGANLGRRFEDKAKDELADGYYEDDGSGSFQPGARSRFAADDDAESPELLERRLRESIEARAKARYETIVVSCRPLPQETPRAMYFRFWGDNPFVYTSNDKLATFAADVDTASYTLARKYLVDGLLPTKEQVRTEEFVNYFHGDIAPPSEGVFAVRNEAVISPFGGSANRYMLRVGIRGKVVPKEDRPPMALVYVVDTSGSMRQGNRMDLVKHSLRLLGTELDGRDQVGIVTFSDTAKLLLPMTSMDQRATLESAIQGLTPDGSTNVEDGMRLGYELLSRVPAEGRLRRVVLISDGVANTGQTSADAISEEVRVHRQNGIYLSTIGVGMGNHNDALLERLADRGDGICDYVDDEEAARRAMVDRFSGGFIPIARDLKIQVEFDSKYVLRYRQLGYENRAVADRDFRNDAVDGGEVGSGHQVTALFELDCVPGLGEGDDALAHLGTVRLRYKSVETGENETVSETDHSIDGIRWGSQMDAATPGMQRSLVAAQFAEVLRRSNHAQGDDYAELYRHAARLADLPDFATDKDTLELRDMIRRAGELGAGRPAELSELDRTVNEYRRHVYLSETERQLRGQQTADQLEAIRQANAELERRIQELCLQEARAGR